LDKFQLHDVRRTKDQWCVETFGNFAWIDCSEQQLQTEEKHEHHIGAKKYFKNRYLQSQKTDNAQPKDL